MSNVYIECRRMRCDQQKHCKGAVERMKTTQKEQQQYQTAHNECERYNSIY